MRRNMSGGRGGPSASGGPLITEHLKDIDLELELLKRKREMIEQQHFYSRPKFEPQNQFADYESPYSYNQQHYGSDRDYSHLYDDAPNFGGQHGRKRPDPWAQDGPNAYPNKKKPIQAIFGSRLGPKPVPSGPSNAGPAPVVYQRPKSKPKPVPTAPMPLLATPATIGRKFNRRPVPRPPVGSSKVSKPKPAPAPNNLASKPPAVRANLVAEASKSSGAVSGSPILRKDSPPTPQMTGRLELTLGIIMKEIKDRHGDKPAYASLFGTVHLQRVMKQVIRERMRVALMDKVVSNSIDIKRQYRAKFPEETDVDILNMALDAATLSPDTKALAENQNSEDAADKQFLKVNIFNLIDVRLNELFTKLKDLLAKERQEKGDVKPNLTDTSTVNAESDAIEDEQRKASTVMIRRFLPRLMKKYTSTLATLIDADEINQMVQESLNATKASQVAKCEGSGDSPVEGDGHIDEAVPVRRPPPINLPYYVKIRAKPSLPSKKVMGKFLESFNTKMIKKHRSIGNLLFVGFAQRKDYENMLEANGTTIGCSVLDILPSEKTAKPKQEQNNDSLNTSIDQIISPELDGQITDLLISIRKADEEEKGGDNVNTSESCEKMVIQDDDQLNNGVIHENAPEIKKEIMNTNPEVAVNKEVFEEGNTELEETEDNAVKPTESAQDPEILLEAPEQVLETQSSGTQQEVVEQVSKTDDDKVVQIPTNALASAASPNIAATASPAKVTSTPAIVAATPAKVAATPTKVAPASANVVATPAKVAATTAKAAATPTNAAATPAKVAGTTAKVAATNANVAATPPKVAATPAKVAVTPAKVATTPAKVAATTTKAAATPAKVAAAPPNVVATPAKVAATPVKVAATPAKVAATTAKAAATPAKVAATPAKVAATPAKVATTTAKAAATPAAPRNVAATPAKIAATTAKVVASPVKVAATPANVAAIPAKVATTPDKVAATPANIAAAPTPVKVAETPAKVAEVPDKVPEPPTSDAETKETPENLALEDEKKDAVAELKSDAKVTGRSTPTRMTRSANVTPSTIRTRRASRLAQNQ